MQAPGWAGKPASMVHARLQHRLPGPLPPPSYYPPPPPAGGELLQAQLPDTYVYKAFNTIGALRASRSAGGTASLTVLAILLARQHGHRVPVATVHAMTGHGPLAPHLPGAMHCPLACCRRQQDGGPHHCRPAADHAVRWQQRQEGHRRPGAGAGQLRGAGAGDRRARAVAAPAGVQWPPILPPSLPPSLRHGCRSSLPRGFRRCMWAPSDTPGTWRWVDGWGGLTLHAWLRARQQGGGCCCGGLACNSRPSAHDLKRCRHPSSARGAWCCLQAIAELWIHMGVPGVGEAVKLPRNFHFQFIQE